MIKRRRIWLAEGFSSDGEVYGRALQLPDKDSDNHSVTTEVERKSASVIKTDLGDIYSCPCSSIAMPKPQQNKEGGCDA